MERLLRVVFVLTLLATPFSTSRDSALGGVISFALPLLALFAGLYLVALLMRQRLVIPPRARPLVLVAIAYAGMVNAMAFFAIDVVASLLRSGAHLLGVPLLLFAAGADLRDERKQAERNLVVRRALILSGFALAVYFLTNVSVQVSRFGASLVLYDRGVGGLMELPWGASNVIASVLLLPIFVIGLEWDSKRRGLKILLVVCVCIILAAVAVTSSRGTIVSVLIGFLFYNALLGKMKSFARALVVPVAALGVLALAGIYFFGSEFLLDIFRNRTEDSNIRRIGGRSEVWDATISYIKHHQFQPTGYYGSIYEVGFTGHNIFLTTYVETGFLGIVMVLGLMFSVSYLLWWSFKYKINRSNAAILSSMWIAFMINIQFEDSMFTVPAVVYFWVCLGLSVVVSGRDLMMNGR